MRSFYYLAGVNQNQGEGIYGDSDPLSKQLLIAIFEFRYPIFALPASARCKFDIDHPTFKVRLVQFKCLLKGIPVTKFKERATFGFVYGFRR